MKNIIIILAVALIITAVVIYIVKQKKNGDRCIGCPYAESCNKQDPCKK